MDPRYSPDTDKWLTAKAERDRAEDRAYAIMSMLAFGAGFLAVGMCVLLFAAIGIGLLPWSGALIPMTLFVGGAGIGWIVR